MGNAVHFVDLFPLFLHPDIQESLGEGYQCQLQQNIAAVIRASATTSTDAIDEKLLALQQELLKKAHNKEAYDEIADEIFGFGSKNSRLPLTRRQETSRSRFMRTIIRSS